MGRGLDITFLACVQFSSPAGARTRGSTDPAAAVSSSLGGYSEGETPLPIPNRAVKPLSADGTWCSHAWESRSPPVLHRKAAPRGGFFRARSDSYSPNQRARRLVPKCSLSARSSAEGGRKTPVGVGPERKSTSTRPIR